MKNAIAVAFALLLPLNLIPQIAFAAAGKPKPSNPDILKSRGVDYMKVDVKGEKGPFYCEVDDCTDAKLEKNGHAQLFFDFDGDGDPTLSQYKLTYDPKTKTRQVIKTEANSYSAKVGDTGQDGKATVQVFVAGTSGKSETLYTNMTKGDKLLLKADGKPSGYRLESHPDFPGKKDAYHVVPAKSAPESPVVEKTEKVKPKLADSTLKEKAEYSLEDLCALRTALPDKSAKETEALNQLIATKEGGAGIQPDNPTVASAHDSDLDAKCAQLKKEKALASQTEEGKTSVGVSDPPPNPPASVVQSASGGAANTGLLDNWGSYAGAIGGGVVLAIVAAAIMGGPIGLAAGAGAAVGLVGMALYNNRNEIGQAVSTGVMAIVDLVLWF